MTRCLLALGANLGDRAKSLDNALNLISASPELQLLARSTWHETVPIGGTAGQANFLNGAALVDTTQSPELVAETLRSIEKQLGRERHIRWDARTIDIDLLLYGDKIVDTADLQIPHPRMSIRQFVLVPAAEIAGEMLHLTSGWTIAALSSHWSNSPRTVAIAGKDPELSQWLGEALQEQLSFQSSDLDDPDTIKLVWPDQAPSMAIVLCDSNTVSQTIGLMRPVGPIARITTSDRANVLQEALAAVRAAWPD
jgi:2-amino-4-hydroxy-6-hydroxymethyldihydropteridine diphosphokinase